MNLFLSRWSLVCGLSFFLIGCSKQIPLEPMALEQAEEALESAFNQAEEDFRAMAERISSLIEQKNYPAAHQQLSLLSSNPDLTSEQRQVIAGLFLAVNQELARAGAAGDVKAVEALNSYHMNK